MVAANYDWSLQFAFCDEVVQCDAEAIAFAVAEPADASRQPLKADAFLCELNPARKNFVVRKHVQHELVRLMNVGRLSGKRRPPERAAAFAEQRTNICGHETGKVVGVFHALLKRESADIVAVVESDGAQFL